MQSIAFGFGAYRKLLEFHFCHEDVSLEVQHSRLTLGEAAMRITYGKACFQQLYKQCYRNTIFSFFLSLVASVLHILIGMSHAQQPVLLELECGLSLSCVNGGLLRQWRLLSVPIGTCGANSQSYPDFRYWETKTTKFGIKTAASN